MLGGTSVISNISHGLRDYIIVGSIKSPEGDPTDKTVIARVIHTERGSSSLILPAPHIRSAIGGEDKNA